MVPSSSCLSILVFHASIFPLSAASNSASISCAVLSRSFPSLLSSLSGRTSQHASILLVHGPPFPTGRCLPWFGCSSLHSFSFQSFLSPLLRWLSLPRWFPLWLLGGLVRLCSRTRRSFHSACCRRSGFRRFFGVSRLSSRRRSSRCLSRRSSRRSALMVLVSDWLKLLGGYRRWRLAGSLHVLVP